MLLEFSFCPFHLQPLFRAHPLSLYLSLGVDPTGSRGRDKATEAFGDEPREAAETAVTDHPAGGVYPFLGVAS